LTSEDDIFYVYVIKRKMLFFMDGMKIAQAFRWYSIYLDYVLKILKREEICNLVHIHSASHMPAKRVY